MNLVTLEGVHMQYSERVLLDSVDLRINSGDRIGLIGVNGSGKSTLLRIVAGLETPNAGSVTVWGGVRIRYLAQEPALDLEASVLEALYAGRAGPLDLLGRYQRASRALAERPDDALRQDQLGRLVAEIERQGAWTAEAEAKAVLTRLGIDDFEARVGSLSGGQQKRVALAQALVDPADLLVLDEPTNHVDAETIAWLERYLLRVPRSLLMVTHDRYFLDRVVNRIIELDRRQLVSYPESYRRYLELRTNRHEQLAKREEDRRRELRRELEWLRRGAKARSTKQKARSQRVAEMETIAYDSGEQRVALALAGRRLGKRVLEAKGLTKAWGGRPVLRGIDLRLGPGERIGILGPNGAGKSSLLDILTGHVKPDAGSVSWGDTVEIGYFDQRSAGLRDAMKLIDYIEQEAPLIQAADGERVSASKMLEWLLFPGPQQHAWIGSLSGGERRRLYLLRTLIHRPNVLILDEPTNDLDIETLGVLEGFLEAFSGSLIVVSHDRYFLDRTVDQLAVLEDGRLHAGYPTPFETFLRLRETQRKQAAEATATTLGPTGGSAGAPRAEGDGASRGAVVADGPTSTTAIPAPGRKLSWKEARELEEVEARLEALEARKRELADALNQAGADFERIQALSESLQGVEEALDLAGERWLELSEIADGA
ncbi:MAG: ABC-F family ATP-binding cassette domain-containing protein [Chloroflexi bacterium]|nr:ABC-F family ATP-binding cassette domain-containing protein [Chloroflexota bacterium]